jgi:hypothetical protein
VDDCAESNSAKWVAAQSLIPEVDSTESDAVRWAITQESDFAMWMAVQSLIRQSAWLLRV